MEGTEEWMDAIRFYSPEKEDIGDKIDKIKVIELINKAIKADPELFEGENLFGGIKEFFKDFTINFSSFILTVLPACPTDFTLSKIFSIKESSTSDSPISCKAYLIEDTPDIWSNDIFIDLPIRLGFKL